MKPIGGDFQSTAVDFPPRPGFRLPPEESGEDREKDRLPEGEQDPDASPDFYILTVFHPPDPPEKRDSSPTCPSPGWKVVEILPPSLYQVEITDGQGQVSRQRVARMGEVPN